MNNNESYRRSVLVTTSKKKAYKALTKEIDKWWGKMDKPVEKKGIFLRSPGASPIISLE